MNEEAQQRIIEEAKEFAEREIRPFATKFDQDNAIPVELINNLAARGYLGANIPAAFGGLALDAVYYGRLTEVIGMASSAVRSILTVHSSLVAETLLRFGTEDQKKELLPLMAMGEKLAAFALTEPNTGTDAKSISTSYKQTGEVYIINGKKKWITLAGIADLFMVIASNNEMITAFLVPAKSEGITITPINGLMAGRATYMAAIDFHNVVVSKRNILGKEGSGFTYIVNTALDFGRYSVAWGALGIAQAALEAMVTYARIRKQFGKGIYTFQLIQGMIGDAVTKLSAGRALCLQAGELRKKGHQDAAIETTIAKYYISKIANEVAADAVQVHGGNGISHEYVVERLFRDAKTLEIIEGTSQVLQVIIADHGLSRYNKPPKKTSLVAKVRGSEYQLLPVSGKTIDALKENVSKLLDYLNATPTANVTDIAYTLQMNQSECVHRHAVVCKNVDEALAQFSSEKLPRAISISPNQRPKVVFMFSGQGTQYVNMYFDLYKKEHIYRQHIDACFEIVQNRWGKDLRSIVFPSKEELSTEYLYKTEFAQPLLFIMEYALAQLLISWGINPDVMIGHSFGEYVAACVGGVFSLEDALYLTVKRGELMQRVSKGKMLGISIREETLKKYLFEETEIALAIVNSTELCVVSGNDAAIIRLQGRLEQDDYSCKIIPNAPAYHSMVMDTILAEYTQIVKQVDIKKHQIPIISNVTGKPVTDTELSSVDYWIKHLRGTVLFSAGINTILAGYGDTVFLELGPGVELSAFVRSNECKQKQHKVISLVRHQETQESDDLHLLKGIGKLWSYGVPINWSSFRLNEKNIKIINELIPAM